MDIATFKNRLRQHGAPPAEPVVAPEGETFVTYARLPDYGIPSYSRIHLRRLQARGLFPRAVYLTPNRCAWKLSDLRHWVATRCVPAGGEAA